MRRYSHSKLSTFEMCPYCYQLKYIDRIKIEKVRMIEAFMGSMVHETLEQLYKLVGSCKIPTLEETLDDYVRRWGEQWSDDIKILDPDLSAENYKEIGRTCIQHFYKRHSPFDQGIILGLEKRISLPLDGEHTITGSIDRLMRPKDGVFEIHDYKTSKHLYTQDEADADRQLGLYETAVRQDFPEAEEIRLVWHFLRYDTRLESIRSTAQRNTLCQDTLHLIQEIESIKEFPTNETNLCKWCGYINVCRAKGHRIKVAALPANRFLEEDGVKLVNRLAELSEKKKKFNF